MALSRQHRCRPLGCEVYGIRHPVFPVVRHCGGSMGEVPARIRDWGVGAALGIPVGRLRESLESWSLLGGAMQEIHELAVARASPASHKRRRVRCNGICWNGANLSSSCSPVRLCVWGVSSVRTNRPMTEFWTGSPRTACSSQSVLVRSPECRLLDFPGRRA